MFIVILGAVLALMHLYLWKRLVKDTTRLGRTRWVLSAVLVALATLLLATLIQPRTIGVTESAWFAWPGYLWFGLVAYLFLTLLVLEPVRLALRGWTKRTPQTATETAVSGPPAEETPTASAALNRRLFLARASAVAAGAASIGLVGVGTANAVGPPDMLRVPMRLPRLDPAFNGFRIAVVSDIHLGPLAGRARTERIVRMINQTEPDLVAIVGDLVDGTVEELGSAAEPLQDLDPREGTFFVTGNHEYFVEDTPSWLRELERLDVRPLRNENTAIRRGAAAFDLAGVNDIAGEKIRPTGFRPRLIRGGFVPTDDSACPPTGSGGGGCRARGGPAVVRAHSRWPDVAVPLHRPARATVPRRIVNRGEHTAVRHTGRRILGSTGADRRAAGHHRAVTPGGGLVRSGQLRQVTCLSNHSIGSSGWTPKKL